MRIAVCETLGYFFVAGNKDGSTGNLLLQAGTTTSNPITFIYYATYTGGTSTTVTNFDIFYKCSATPADTYLAIVYSSSSKFLFFVKMI